MRRVNRGSKGAVVWAESSMRRVNMGSKGTAVLPELS